MANILKMITTLAGIQSEPADPMAEAYKKATDEEIWRTTKSKNGEGGKHYKIETTTGEIKAGNIGVKNIKTGKKAKPSVTGAKTESYKVQPWEGGEPKPQYKNYKYNDTVAEKAADKLHHLQGVSNTYKSEEELKSTLKSMNFKIIDDEDYDDDGYLCYTLRNRDETDPNQYRVALDLERIPGKGSIKSAKIHNIYIDKGEKKRRDGVENETLKNIEAAHKSAKPNTVISTKNDPNSGNVFAAMKPGSKKTAKQDGYDIEVMRTNSGDEYRITINPRKMLGSEEIENVQAKDINKVMGKLVAKQKDRMAKSGSQFDIVKAYANAPTGSGEEFALNIMAVAVLKGKTATEAYHKAKRTIEQQKKSGWGSMFEHPSYTAKLAAAETYLDKIASKINISDDKSESHDSRSIVKQAWKQLHK